MRYAAIAVMSVAGCRAVLGLDPPVTVDAYVPDEDAPDAVAIDGPAPKSCTNDTNLIACFDFDNSIIDAAPSPNQLSASNVLFTSMGKVGSAIVLEAASRVQINDSVQLDAAAVSIEAWIYPTQAPSTTARAVVWDTDGQYAFFLRPNLTLSCVGSATLDGVAVTLDRWTHVACTMTGTAMRIYVDGKEVSTAVTTTALNTSATMGAEIGGNAPDGLDRFIGRIDAVRVYRTVRMPSEICADAGC